ncbi:MAG: 3-oxoacyl-[acyl-carrier protein] reductase [Chloroflexi bacterium]|nr:3-oxoacyl-[acyl-carrier protein] reductase [Chloroflexota bacterium]
MIGRACVGALLAEGATVVVVDRDENALRTAATAWQETSRRVLTLAVDVTDEPAVLRMVDEVQKQTGRLDVLVNCLGVFQATPIDELSLDDWQHVLDINLTSIFLCCRAAARVMKGQGSGRIINLGSLAGRVGGLAAGANYSVSKAGVICLTKSLARALGGTGITVNTINPGPVDSPMVDAWPPGKKEEQLARIPLGRLGRPQDIAGAVVFLASDAASYIHGAQIDVNGGLEMS